MQKLYKFPVISLSSVEIHVSQMAHISVQQASAHIIRRTLNKSEDMCIYRTLDRTAVLYYQSPFGNIWLPINDEVKRFGAWMGNDRKGSRQGGLSGRIAQHSCVSWDRQAAAPAGGHALNSHPYLGRQNSTWIFFQQCFRMQALEYGSQ